MALIMFVENDLFTQLKLNSMRLFSNHSGCLNDLLVALNCWIVGLLSFTCVYMNAYIYNWLHSSLLYDLLSYLNCALVIKVLHHNLTSQ